VNKLNGQKQAHAQVRITTKQKGDAAEDRALHYLQTKGLKLIHRNYRTPGRGGGEIDLIMQETDSTLVFVEVRQRVNDRHGGALASVTAVKRRRIVFAARHYLLKYRQMPPCRFDIVAMQGDDINWFQSAFDAE